MNELITKSPDNSSNPYIALQDYFDFPNPFISEKKSEEPSFFKPNKLSGVSPIRIKN
jgi:hypothetical protein